MYEKAEMTSACALLIANDILQAVDNVYLLMFVILNYEMAHNREAPRIFTWQELVFGFGLDA